MAQGCYVPEYQIASFKGVTFQCLEVSSEHGRRGAEGEFVFGERTGYIDLGRKIRRYKLSARFVRNSHIRDTATIIRACESKGAGILVHPTRGAVRAACTMCSVRDNPIEEQGVSYADLEFVEAENVSSLFPLSFGFGIDLSGFLNSASLSFVANYNIKSSMFYDVAYLTSRAARAITTIKNEFLKTIPVAASSEIWKVVGAFDDVINNTKNLRNADAFVDNLSSGMQLLFKSAPTQDKYDAFKAIANAHAETSSLLRLAGNTENALNGVVRLYSAAYMAKAADESTTPTLGDAIDQIDKILVILEGEADIAKAACENNLFLAISKFKNESKQRLLARAYNLPSLVQYDLGRGLHGLSAAHEIWGDATRVREIEARNPQFAPWVNGPSIVGTNV
jgi:hypothetical protein